MKQYIFQNAVALDQLANTMIPGGMADETLSARAYRIYVVAVQLGIARRRNRIVMRALGAKARLHMQRDGCGVGLSGAVCGSAHRASTLMVCLDVNAAHVKTHRESGGVVAAPELVTQQSCGAWGFHGRHKP